VRAVELDPLRVVDAAVRGDLVVVRGAVLRDDDRQVAVVPLDARQQLVERVGCDLPAHRGHRLA
jgi:hypothetical protein